MAQCDNINPPVRRTYFLDYMGSLKVHRLYTKAMLHWVVAEVKYQRNVTFCSLTLDQGMISAKKEEKMLIDVSSSKSENGISNGSDSVSAFLDPLASLDNGLDKNSNQADCLPLECPLDRVIEIVPPNELEHYCVGFLKTPNQYDGPFTCHVFHDKEKSLVSILSIRFTTCYVFY